jgi:hypothetical protein
MSDSRFPRFPFPALPTLLFAISCGAEGPQTPDGADQRLDPATCARGWRVVHSPRQEGGIFSFGREELLWHGGHLYFHQDGRKRGLHSVPVTGGEASVVVEGGLWDAWIEDDRLLYVQDLRLFSKPLAGGPAQEITYGRSLLDQAKELPSVTAWGLDRDALYWSRDRYLGDLQSEVTIWRGSRGGGEETSAVLPVRKNANLVRSIIPVGDDLVVTHGLDGPLAWALPRTGGPAREVASLGPTSKLLGVSAAGEVLWSAPGGGFDGTKGSERYLVARGRLTEAAPQPFWVGKPRNAYPMGAWDRGGGRWYVSTWEWGTDGALHTAVWSVNALGDGKRLACDPEVGSRLIAGAAAPDAHYGVVRYTNQYWQVIAVAAD